jgi:AraC-like DNA-binding protein
MRVEGIKKFETIGDYVGRFGFDTSTGEDFYIYKYSDIQESSGFYINSFRNNFFEISLDLSDGCPYFIDGYKCISGKNRISLISPYRLQSIIKSEHAPENMQGYSLFFEASFLNLYPENKNLIHWLPLIGNQYPIVQLEDTAADKFIDLFEKIIFHQGHPTPESKNIIRHYTNIILLMLKDRYTMHQFNSNSRDAAIYAAFTQLLSEHFPEFSTVQAFADKLHLSPKHFSETVKEVSGKTAIQIISEHKIDFAKSLLMQTNMSIKQIAATLQFENEAYFYTFFKRMTLSTPAAFRKK